MVDVIVILGMYGRVRMLHLVKLNDVKLNKVKENVLVKSDRTLMAVPLFGIAFFLQSLQ